jgi:DNA-binding NtrC family response regulator
MEPVLGRTDEAQQPASPVGPDVRAGGATKTTRGKCRVMVVEDDAPSRTALVMLLKHIGFETTFATNVADAMRMVSSIPSAVILDLMLPDGNGASVLEHVRQAGLSTRVAVATGAGDWKSMVDEVRLKPDAVFIKPIDFPRLVRWLDEKCTPAN